MTDEILQDFARLFETLMLCICGGAVVAAIIVITAAERKRFEHRRMALRSAALGLGFLAIATGFIGLFSTIFNRPFLPWT